MTRARKRVFSFALIIALMVSGMSTALAAGSTSITYSSGNTATWDFSNFGINDVSTTSTVAGGRSDAYDGAMILSVCSDASCTYTGGSYTSYAGAATYDSNLRTHNGAPATINGLNVTAKMRLSASLVAGRMLASFENTSGAAITRVIKIYSNLGSDGSTSLKYTSSNQTLSNQTLPVSGNSNYWSISAQDAGLVGSNQAASDPINSYVWGTPGAAITGSANINNGDINWIYTLTIPANSTQSILFVFGLGEITSTSNTFAGALAGLKGNLDSYTKLPADMMDDLSASEIASIQNWVISPSPSAFTSSQSSPTNTTSPITYSLTMSQSITGLASGDFSNAGTAQGCSFTPSASAGTTFTLTISGCGEGTLRPQLLANTVTGTQTGPTVNSPASTTIVIDRTAPTISSVVAPASATYVPGGAVAFTVEMNESVTVSGVPRLTLTVGSVTKYATYSAGSNGINLTFTYTVGNSLDEIDLDGIAVATTLELNSGAIADLASNSLSSLTFTAPTLTSVLVAQKPGAPTISSITPSDAQLSVAFTAGASNGSSLTTFEYSTDNGATWKSRASGGTSSPLVITAISSSSSTLVNGTSYSIRIRGVNAAGSGESSTAVSATPSAILITGDSTLTLTYGNSASTGAYSASGGTGSYTFSLGSAIAGITLSGTTVTVANTLAAGTYSQSVRVTDSNSQIGSKSLTITVNKASTSISIALPENATTAAASGTVVITATVPQSGSVNFKIGGTTISGCGSTVAASTTATCTWTAPGSLGSVTLTAIFTPTDSANYESSTSSNLIVTVVDGISTVSISLAGGVTQVPKGQAITITAAIDQAGKVTFFVDGKRIPGCINKRGAAGNITCSWKPGVQKQVTIKAALTPTSNIYQPSSQSMSILVVRRAGNR